MAVSMKGAVVKSTYCNNCFTILEWDEPTDELTVMGNRVILCPNCGSYVNIDDTYVQAGGEVQPFNLEEPVYEEEPLVQEMVQKAHNITIK